MKKCRIPSDSDSASVTSLFYAALEVSLIKCAMNDHFDQILRS